MMSHNSWPKPLLARICHSWQIGELWWAELNITTVGRRYLFTWVITRQFILGHWWTWESISVSSKVSHKKTLKRIFSLGKSRITMLSPMFYLISRSFPFNSSLFTISCWVFVPTRAYHSVISRIRWKLKAPLDRYVAVHVISLHLMSKKKYRNHAFKRDFL